MNDKHEPTAPELELASLFRQELLELSRGIRAHYVRQASLGADGVVPTPDGWREAAPEPPKAAERSSARAQVSSQTTSRPSARKSRADAQQPSTGAAAKPASTLSAFQQLAQTERSAGLPDAPASLELLRSQLDGCTRCKLHLKRNHIVFGEGAENAELIFVGEGPGADEDASGRPFVGAAGQLMDRIIGAMGLNRERIFIGNVVKCRPPGNRDPEPDEISTCRPFLLQQIAYIRPKLIVTWGRVASHALLGVRTPITHMRGKWQSLYGIDLMPTLHPSYLLRQPEAKKLVWQDMQAVLARLGLPVPERKRRES